MEIIIGALATVMALGYKIHHDARRRRQRRFAAWRQAGEQFGAAVVHEGDDLGFEVEIDDACVLAAVSIDHESGFIDGVVSAHYVVVGSGPDYEIRPQQLPDALGKLVGATEDVELETSAVFDDQFLVSCVDREATRAAWPWRLMHAAARATACTSVVSHADQVIATVHPEASRDEIVAIVELIGQLASVDLIGHSILAEIRATRFVPPRGPFDARLAPRAVVETRADVEVRFAEHNGRLITSVWTTTTGAEREIRIDGGVVTPDAQSHDLPTAALKEVGVCSLKVSEQTGAVLAWDDIETDPARLEAGIALVLAATTQPQGPYR